MAHSILLWRSILQWLGGVGFIVMAVAVLPYLNVGGMKLFQTELGLVRQERPRAKTVANNMVLVYLVLSMLCFLAYWVSGMNLFEAVNHAMTTLSTGGYSTSDQSMSHFSRGALDRHPLHVPRRPALPALCAGSPAVTTACSRMPRCRASSG